jgi:hypothetical protein
MQGDGLGVDVALTDGVGVTPVGDGVGVDVVVALTDGVGVTPVGDGVGVDVVVALTVGVGVTPVGDGDGVAVGVAVAVAVAVGVAPRIPCPESSTCCGLFLAESVNVRAFLSLTFPEVVGWKRTATSHDAPAVRGEPEHPSVWIEKGDAATIVVNSTEADFDLLVTVIVTGALIRETMALPKSCLSGLILSVPVESEFFASGTVARSAATATS